MCFSCCCCCSGAISLLASCEGHFLSFTFLTLLFFVTTPFITAPLPSSTRHWLTCQRKLCDRKSLVKHTTNESHSLSFSLKSPHIQTRQGNAFLRASNGQWSDEWRRHKVHSFTRDTITGEKVESNKNKKNEWKRVRLNVDFTWLGS